MRTCKKYLNGSRRVFVCGAVAEGGQKVLSAVLELAGRSLSIHFPAEVSSERRRESVPGSVDFFAATTWRDIAL